MPRPQLEASAFSPDTRQFIAFLHQHEVRYLIVGGEAVILYGFARLTGDVDFFFEATQENVVRLFNALLEFWNGNIPGLEKTNELLEPGVIVQFGRPPNRIDLINQIDGVNFDEAWTTRVTVDLKTEGDLVSLNYIGLDCLMKNKKASGRPKDLADLEYLAKLKSLPPLS